MNTPSVESDANPSSLGLSVEALSALLADIFSEEALADYHPEEAPAFDPISIRDLIREAASEGKHPAKLILGHKEATSYCDFLLMEYGELPPKGLKDSYFLGLQIVEDDVPSRIALEGNKPHDAWDAQLPPPWKDDQSPSSEDQAA